jgi:transposase
MPRTMLTDEHWLKLYSIVRSLGIYDKRNLRLTVEGIFYRLRVGCPWRDVPKEFGNWSNLYRRFNDWSRKGKILEMFQKLIVEPDLEWEFIDGSIVKAHLLEQRSRQAKIFSLILKHPAMMQCRKTR